MGQAINAKYILSFHNNEPLIIENGTILVDNNEITGVGKDLDIEDRENHNFESHILLPGLINTHSHAAMTLFRSYADDTPLNDWLNNYIWPLEAKLTKEQVKIGAKLAAIELIMSGTTTINSMYWHPDGELEAFKEIGVRLMAGPPIISGVNTYKKYEYLIEKWHGKNDDMARISINPHAPYTVTPDEYQELHRYKNEFNQRTDGPKIMLHTHLAESKDEMQHIKNYAKENDFELPDGSSSPTQYLDNLGVLDDELIAAHVVECSNTDIETLVNRKVGLSTNTVSNMKLGNRTPKIDEMIQKEAKIGIGTDGPASNNSLNMFETMKTTALVQKSKTADPAVVSAKNALTMGTIGGAKVLGWENIGAVRSGYKADLILIDLNKPHLRPIPNNYSLLSSLVYSAQGNDVTDVMINGQWKMKGRDLINIDLPKTITKFEDTVHSLINSNDNQ